jgi:hypothetical protein
MRVCTPPYGQESEGGVYLPYDLVELKEGVGWWEGSKDNCGGVRVSGARQSG